MRIINIVESLDKGAVENWLVSTFLQSIRSKPEWKWTFYCILGKEGRLDEIVRRAGAEIIYSPASLSSKWQFLKGLRKILKEGRYDIIHSHHDYLSGFYLIASWGIRFRQRVLHIHNTDKIVPVRSRWLQKFLVYPLRSLACYFSDTVVGISNDTLDQFVDGKSLFKARSRVLYYGIDMHRFKPSQALSHIRIELNLPRNSKLILFSGRMIKYKNPVFVVKILHQLLKKNVKCFVIFAGEGELIRDIQSKATEYGITNNIRLIGWRNDLASVMQSCDLFVFPRLESPKEGLGLVVVEAQAAGLPMVISPGIVVDAIVLPELTNYLPLDDNPTIWADKIIDIFNNPPAISKEYAFEKMAHSHFELGIATNNFVSLYES